MSSIDHYKEVFRIKAYDTHQNQWTDWVGGTDEKQLVDHFMSTVQPSAAKRYNFGMFYKKGKIYVLKYKIEPDPEKCSTGLPLREEQDGRFMIN